MCCQVMQVLLCLPGMSLDSTEFSTFRKKPLSCTVTCYHLLSLKCALFLFDATVQTSPAELSVLERGLVVSDLHWKDIVKEEKRYSAHIKRTFQGPVLGYVTPVSF